MAAWGVGSVVGKGADRAGRPKTNRTGYRGAERCQGCDERGSSGSVRPMADPAPMPTDPPPLEPVDRPRPPLASPRLDRPFVVAALAIVAVMTWLMLQERGLDEAARQSGDDRLTLRIMELQSRYYLGVRELMGPNPQSSAAARM